MSKLNVVFKSTDDYYFKEKSGKKPNTIRKADMKDKRFIILKAVEDNDCPECLSITIKHISMDGTITDSFTKDVLDVSSWSDYFIVSWEHKKVR